MKSNFKASLKDNSFIFFVYITNMITFLKEMFNALYYMHATACMQAQHVG